MKCPDIQADTSLWRGREVQGDIFIGKTTPGLNPGHPSLQRREESEFKSECYIDGEM